MDKTRRAVLLSTGNRIIVYPLKSGGWGLYIDGGKTTFKDEEIKLLD